MPRIALYQPDIPQNVGSIIRLCACMSTPLDIIEPCGFPFDYKRLKRAALDYFEHVALTRHSSWEAFLQTVGGARIVLLSTKAATPYTEFAFKEDDILLFGRESAGVPEQVHAHADARVIIPMNPKTRSLNVAITAAMVLGEAVRQARVS